MFVSRVDGDDFEIVRANPQVILTTPTGSMVVGTLQLLTKGGPFEIPLSSRLVSGNGWSGMIVEYPDIALPGQISPFVWIHPKRVTAGMRRECLEVVRTADGSLTVNVPDKFKIMWETTGGPADKGYSLKPTLVLTEVTESKFLAATPGSLPSREDEGSVARMFGGTGIDEYGVVVDIDEDTKKGYAVPLSRVVTPHILSLLGLK